MKIVVVDYGMGNLHSVVKSLQYANSLLKSPTTIELTSDADTVHRADKVVFPGQGAMPRCMQSLQQSGLASVLKESFKSKPFLGICIGAQLLFDYSEEGDTQALGWYPGQVTHFNKLNNHTQKIKIPHMGWNTVLQTKQHPLFNNIPQQARFYFVHSYYFEPEYEDIVIATSEYPNEFPCVIGSENVFATQFHVEKSQNVGLLMLQNFILWDGQS